MQRATYNRNTHARRPMFARVLWSKQNQKRHLSHHYKRTPKGLSLRQGATERRRDTKSSRVQATRATLLPKANCFASQALTAG